MAQFLDGGSMVFDALAYGQQHPGTQSFLAQQFETASNTLTDAGAMFMSQAREMYERLSSSTAARKLRAVTRSIRSYWQIDEIRALRTIDQLQNAAPRMQRWIMAEPTVRALHLQQRVDGYSDTYFDIDPQGIGETHYDFRRAMDGIVVVNEDAKANEPEWTADSYLDDLLPDDDHLSLEEQVEIFETWEFAKAAIIANREDPTSRYNADLS